MNPHDIRVSIYETKEQYLSLKKEWAKTKTHSALEHLIYNVLRGYDPERGFTPITRQSRIDNGHAGEYNEVAFYLRHGIHAIQNWDDSKNPGWKSWAHDTTEKSFARIAGDVINFNVLEKAYELATSTVRTIREGGND